MKAPTTKRGRAGRPTAAEIARRKASVLNVATELFVDKGYAATSLIEIAQVSGVASGTLYSHFGDKEGLFRAVIRAPDESIPGRPQLRCDDTLSTALVRLANYICDMSLRPQAVQMMRLLIIESQRFNGLMGDVARDSQVRFQEVVCRALEEMANAGLLPRGEHERSAELLIDLILGGRAVRSYADWDFVRPSHEDLEERVDLFINGRIRSARDRT